MRILEDAGDFTRLQQEEPQTTTTDSSRFSGGHIQADLVEKASEKPCGQNTYNQLMKYADCGLTDTIALLPIFNSFDDHHTKVVPKKVTPRGKNLKTF